MSKGNYKLCEWCEEAEGSLCQKCGFRYVCYDCLKYNPLEPTEPLCPACKKNLEKGVEIARSIVDYHSKRLGFSKPIWLSLEKESKMTVKTFDRMRDWRNFAEHMSAYIKDFVLKKYQTDGKDERVDLMHFQTAKAAAWNCLKYGLRIFNGAGKRHDWEKIAHYAEIGWHLSTREKVAAREKVGKTPPGGETLEDEIMNLKLDKDADKDAGDKLTPEQINVGGIYRHRLDGHALLVLKPSRLSGKDGEFQCRFRYDPEDEDSGYGQRNFRAVEMRFETKHERMMREKFGSIGPVQ